MSSVWDQAAWVGAPKPKSAAHVKGGCHATVAHCMAGTAPCGRAAMQGAVLNPQTSLQGAVGRASEWNADRKPLHCCVPGTLPYKPTPPISQQKQKLHIFQMDPAHLVALWQQHCINGHHASAGSACRKHEQKAMAIDLCLC